MRPSAPTVALALLAIGLANVAESCRLDSFQVSYAGAPPLPVSASAYSTLEVQQALEGLGSFTSKYVYPTETTFACVDARGSSKEVATLETPGGDMSELAALIVAYHRVKDMNATEESVARIFKAFMDNVASTTRPFYFHTADDKLSKYVFPHVLNVTGEHVVVIPAVEPTNETEKQAWYDAFTLPDAQGCGHIRLTMQRPTDYDLDTEAEQSVMKWLITSFFKYWWPTKEGSKERAKVVMPILQGTLDGHAMTIVNNAGPACLDMEPVLLPFHGGSTQFLYQSNAVETLRSSLLIPFIKLYDRDVNASQVTAALTDLQGVQLTSTLTYLAPVNSIPIYSVNVTTYSG